MTAVEEQFKVLVHPYRSPTRGTCAYEMGNTSSRNAVIFIGGLSDGPHTTSYIRTVARQLETAMELSYSVFEIRMRSSFVGYGTASLKSDVDDISALVKYLRALGRDKIVLFGHSTGCQDCMEYTHYAKHNCSPVDGFVLQAPVSDRESLELTWPDHKASLDLAAEWIAQGKADDCLPNELVPDAFGVPMSAYRMHSLFAKGGDDDYFSSDLDDETVARVWGRFKKPVLVLHSEMDEFVPDNVDQAALNKKYRDANPVVSPLSGLIPGAGHTVTGEEAREWVAGRVAEFLRTLKA
ncbi:alpha/beta hydrolase family protein [Hirsutella rhossiliensis]|uniref:Alpha/beta hydrolase family domain-containing protein n=1 Tax=Hirsutella rhossiliensis TaxID=111463 RepID=A0A9P8MS23_9HYPO|nr:alpha/beta hydrolase family domain-containing protein [Hirsutella rhossiliensis]KAH0959171.1 alpha/beta hydrolase family domain-containing protein [Hirsutella rhossiliensis]